MGVTLAVEDIVFRKGSGVAITKPIGYDKQKLWTSNNFRFTLSKFEAQCKRVTKIDSFTIKQTITEHHMGGFRAPIKCPSQVEFPNIVFYVPESDSQAFVDYFKTRGVDGDVPTPIGPKSRLSGSITTYGNDGLDLFELTFTNADICTIQPEKLDAGSEDIKLVKIEIYTEKMKFKYYKRS